MRANVCIPAKPDGKKKRDLGGRANPYLGKLYLPAYFSNLEQVIRYYRLSFLAERIDVYSFRFSKPSRLVSADSNATHIPVVITIDKIECHKTIRIH